MFSIRCIASLLVSLLIKAPDSIPKGFGLVVSRQFRKSDTKDFPSLFFLSLICRDSVAPDMVNKAVWLLGITVASLATAFLLSAPSAILYSLAALTIFSPYFLMIGVMALESARLRLQAANASQIMS